MPVPARVSTISDFLDRGAQRWYRWGVAASDKEQAYKGANQFVSHMCVYLGVNERHSQIERSGFGELRGCNRNVLPQRGN